MDGRPADTDGAGLTAVTWSALALRALEGLALAGPGLSFPGSVPRPRPAIELDALTLASLERGATVLAGALGVAGPELPTRSFSEDDDHADRACARACLRRSAELAASLGEAARRVALTAGLSGQEPAAEVADAVMTAALALRILAEIGLHAVPPVDADGVLPR